MSIKNDPKFYETGKTSGYEPRPLDRWWTHPWMVKELLKPNAIVSKIGYDVWECAAGRGDMARVFNTHGAVYSSDIDMSEFDYDGPGHECNFLDEYELPMIADRPVTAIITNPPYSNPHRGVADDFIEHGLGFFDQGVKFMAMLMRSEFKNGKSKRRQEKFGECAHYMGELVLTTRPRWDYGDPDAPKDAAPRHNFSWFLWAKDYRVKSGLAYVLPLQIFSYMPKGFKP